MFVMNRASYGLRVRTMEGMEGMKGMDGRTRKQKSVGQMKNEKRGKDYEARSVKRIALVGHASVG